MLDYRSVAPLKNANFWGIYSTDFWGIYPPPVIPQAKVKILTQRILSGETGAPSGWGDQISDPDPDAMFCWEGPMVSGSHPKKINLRPVDFFGFRVRKCWKDMAKT